jgi:hypothetical protein
VNIVISFGRSGFVAILVFTTMGSHLSSHQGGGDSTTPTKESRFCGRKRKRDVTKQIPTDSGKTNEDEEDHRHLDESSVSLSKENPSREKKRCRLSTHSLPPVFSQMWDVINERTARWFAKYFFLNFLELATENAKGGELSREDDMRNGIITMLDYFQKQDLDILRRGWRALCIVVGCTQRPGQLPAREERLEEDAALVAMVMEHCSDNGMIQLLGCRALRVLVCGGDAECKSNESNRNNWKCLHRAGVLGTLLNTIRFCNDERTIQGLCLSFVAMLIKELGEPVKRDILMNGGIHILLQACREWSFDGGVLHTLLCVLYQLTTQTTRQTLVDHGAVPLLCGCIMTHYNHNSIIELILGTLNQLSIVSETIFSGHTLVPKMLLLLTLYPDNETIQFFGMVLLRAAGRTDPIPLEPAANRVIEALRRFPDASGVLFFSCALMWQLLRFHSTEQNEALMLFTSMGGLEHIISAVNRHNDVYGLVPVVHLILMYAWENRPTENEAATQAFGGSDDIANLITGIDDNLALRNNAEDGIDDH